MDKDSAAWTDSISNESHSCGQVLAYVLPWDIHHVQHFVGDFLEHIPMNDRLRDLPNWDWTLNLPMESTD